MKLNTILFYFYIILFIQNNQEIIENKNSIEIELYSNLEQTIEFIHLDSANKSNVVMYIN